jgi:hypothetical protein
MPPRPPFDAVLGAVHRAPVDGAGEPVGTEVRPLDPAEARALLGEDVAATYANAGHLPAVLVRPGTEPDQIGEAGAGSVFAERTTPFPPGTDLVLRTDGLAESRTRDLPLGIGRLPAVPAAAGPGPAWHELAHRRHDDDIALIHVRHGGKDGT